MQTAETESMISIVLLLKYDIVEDMVSNLMSYLYNIAT